MARRTEQHQLTVCDASPDNIPLAELAEQVVRSRVKLSPPQLRMLIELLPFHLPKLSAIAVGRLTGDDFASRLDRAVDASNRAKLIEGRVEPSMEGSIGTKFCGCVGERT
jgi:hypothetical protein